jgi:chromate transporter
LGGVPGAAVATVGIFLPSFFYIALLAVDALQRWQAWAIALVSLVALLRWKVSPAWVVLGGGATGLLLAAHR